MLAIMQANALRPYLLSKSKSLKSAAVAVRDTLSTL
jgi:hypothetical protein